MSQFFINGTSGISPPTLLTSIQVDATTNLAADTVGGTVTPAANIVHIQGNNGILTAVDAVTKSLMEIRFASGLTTTTNVQTQTLITFPVLSGFALTFQCLINGLADNNDGIGAWFTAVVKNIGGTASLIGAVDIARQADASLVGCNIFVGVSGGNFLVEVTGVAGRTISWNCILPGIVLN